MNCWWRSAPGRVGGYDPRRGAAHSWLYGLAGNVAAGMRRRQARLIDAERRPLELITVDRLSPAEAAEALGIGVIDDHIAYAAPTSGGGFCPHFGRDPRSGPTGSTCVRRGAERGGVQRAGGHRRRPAVRPVGTPSARKARVTFPRSGETVTVQNQGRQTCVVWRPCSSGRVRLC